MLDDNDAINGGGFSLGWTTCRLNDRNMTSDHIQCSDITRELEGGGV